MNTHKTPTELWAMSAVDLAAGIAAGKFSSREATESALQRLDAVNHQINAVVEQTRDEALAAADRADQAVRRGDKTGVLNGVPITIKMNVDWTGHARNNAIREMQGNIADDDSPVTANLLKSGAVILGQTNTPAFCARSFTSNELYGYTLNPWDPEITPGGSSGGGSAAVAAGIGAIAHGNDLGGSVRQPAHCCGIVGLRSTPSRIPNYNPSVALDRPYVHQSTTSQGPMARSVADAYLGFRAMSQRDYRDPWWSPRLPEQDQAPFPCKVALFYADDEIEPEVRAALHRAAKMLEDAGCTIEDVAPPRYDEAWGLHQSLLQAERATGLLKNIATYGDTFLRTKFDFIGQWDLIEPIETRDDYIAKVAMRTTILREWMKFFETYPLILMPNMHMQALPRDFDQGDHAQVLRAIKACKPHHVTALLALPGLSVPTGVTNGIVDGVQLVANRMQDEFLFRAGAAIEARAGTFTPIDPRGAT